MVDSGTQELLDDAISAMRQMLSSSDCSADDLRARAREVVKSDELESLALWELLNSDDVELTRGATVHLAGAPGSPATA
jgi:hypothetical protein